MQKVCRNYLLLLLGREIEGERCVAGDQGQKWKSPKKVQKCAEKMDRVDRGADECRKWGSQGSYEMWKGDWSKLHTCGGVWDKYCLTQSWRARYLNKRWQSS